MEQVITRFLFHNWERKAIALIAAIVVWVLVNQSITETRTIPNVAIRVTNIPSDKTIVGLLPNNYINQRITLTLSGSKDVIHELDTGDLEVLLDAAVAENDDWIAQITKKNLVSLNPSLDLRHHITHVSHPELVIKLSKLTTDKIPITVRTPSGQAPEGYEYLDIWPEKLMQTLSGPKEELQNLKIKGLKLNLDLNKITKADLELIQLTKKSGHDDELSFIVPEKWKQVAVPFRNNAPQMITDPEAKYLRIDFLKKQLIPIDREIPVSIFYPVKHSETINPSTFMIVESDQIRIDNGIPLFQRPLYVRDVSRLFLDIIRDNIEIIIIAAPKEEREVLQWSLEVIDPREMEDTYVAYVIAEQKDNGIEMTDSKKREEILRKRFRSYLEKLTLYAENNEKLNIVATSEDDGVTIRSET